LTRRFSLQHPHHADLIGLGMVGIGPFHSVLDVKGRGSAAGWPSAFSGPHRCPTPPPDRRGGSHPGRQVLSPSAATQPRNLKPTSFNPPF
jgi:hypothetical protein